MNFFPAYGEDSLYEIQGKKITYEDDKNLIIASGNAYAKDQLGKEIFSDKITYNKKEFTILTSEQSIYLDGKGNKLTTLMNEEKALAAIKAGVAKQGW